MVARFSLLKRNWLFMQTYNILSRRDWSSARKIAAPYFSTGCPLRNPLGMAIEKESYIRVPPNRSGLTHQKFISHSWYMPTQVGRHSDPHGHTETRPTEGCTGAFHSLNSEVTLLSPLVTSSQSALAETSSMAQSDCQRAGKCSLLCVGEGE